MAFDVEGARKAGYSEAEIANYLASQKTFDIAGARKAGYGDQDIIGHLLGAQKPKERTYFEAAKDIGAGVVSGAGALTQLPGQLYGLATGDFSDTGLTKVGREIREAGESMKSEELKRREVERAAKIKEAGKEGEFKAGVTAFMETIKDPALLSNFIAEQAPNLLPGLAVARGLSVAGAGARTAVAGAVGTGAAQQGADIGAGTYVQLYKEMVAKGVPEAEAAGKALGYARWAGADAAAISLAAQLIPGGRAIEQAMAKVPIKSGLAAKGAAAIKGGAGETVSEMIEEGGGKVAQNYFAQKVDPTRSLTEGLGETMGMAAVGGLGLGTAAGLTRGREAPPAEEKPEPEAAQTEPAAPEGAPPEAAPEAAPAVPTDTGLSYGTATQEVELLKRQPKTPETEARIRELQLYKMDVVADEIRRANRPIDQELVDLREQMESGLMTDEVADLAINKIMSDFARKTVNLTTPPKTEEEVELRALITDANKLSRDMATVRSSRGEKNNLRTYLRGKLTPEDVIDIGTDKTFKQYAAKKSDRALELSDMVADGFLDPWLPANMRSEAETFDEKDATEYIKEQVRQENFRPYDAQENERLLGEQLQGIEKRIAELRAPTKVQEAVAEIPIEEAQQEAADIASRAGFEGAPIEVAAVPEEVIEEEYFPDQEEAKGRLAEKYRNSAENIFNKEEIDKFRKTQYKDRKKLIEMRVDDFLALAEEGEVASKLKNARALVAEGKKFNSLPYLNVDKNGKVEGHEGRHRAKALKEAGYDTMPVVLWSDTIRWSEQNDPDSIDYRKFPDRLKAQNGATDESFSIPFPVSREEANKDYDSQKSYGKLEERQPFVINKDPEFERIEKELTGKTLLQVSKWAVDNAPNQFAKAIAQKVLNRLNGMASRGIKLEFDIAGGGNRPLIMRNARGITDYTFGKKGEPGAASIKITLNGAPVVDNQAGYPPGTRYITVLHELLHAATVGQVNVLKGDDPLVRELRDLFNKVVTHFNTEVRAGRLTPFMEKMYASEINALTGPDELIAWGIADQDMQQFLSEIKVGEQTIMDKLVELIRKILNVTKPYLTALDQLVKTTESILDEDVNVVGEKIIAKQYSFGVKPGEQPMQGTLFQEQRNVKTPEFRKWFGKSKVVDQDGKPLVMYHATTADIKELIPGGMNPNLSGPAVWMTPNKEFQPAAHNIRQVPGKPGYMYGSSSNMFTPGTNVMPLYARISNPLVSTDKNWREVYKDTDGASPWTLSVESVKKLKDAGYDGIMHYKEDKLEEIAVFNSNQVKSVFNERPTEAAGILQEQAGAPKTPAQKARAAAQKALQKRTLKKSQFEGVSDDLYTALEPVFAPEKKTIVDKIDGMRDNFWKKLAQGVADQYRSIKDYSPEAYMKARMSKTIDGALEGLLFNGQVKLSDGALDIAPNTKGLMKVLEPVGNEVDRYQIWVALQRDAELVKKGKAPSVNKDIVARRNELSAGKIGDKSRLEVYKQVQKDMNDLNRSVLQVAYKQGIIDEEAFKVYSRDINYIPFYKVMEENGDAQAAATKSGLVNQYFSKELKGGEKPFGDLMENTLRNWSHILSASMKNEAANATVNAAMDVGGAFPNLKVGFEWRLDDDGRNGKVYSSRSGALVGDGSFKPQYTSSDGKGLVKTMIGGKPAYFKVEDPMLLESIMSIGYMGPKSKFLDVARDFKNMLQFGVTLSPAFKIRNLFRDSISAIAVTDLKRNPFANVIQGWTTSDRNNPAHISALAGGAIFNFGSAYEGDQSKLIRRLLDQGIKGNTILDNEKKIEAGLSAAWRAYQDLGNKSESANRMALYNQLKEQGYSHLEASFYARDMLDFSMQGAWPAFRLVTQVIPFLNARVQGLYKLGRDGLIPTSRVIYNTVTGKPIEVTDKQRAEQFSIVMGAVVLASLMLYMAFKDDEEFKKREQWDRDNFWWIKLPGMDSALRVPKPFEIGAMGTLAERVLEQIIDQGAEGKVFGQSLSRMLTDTFAINPIPQVIKPLVDLYANKDSFTGAPIETAGMERLSKAERIADRTSPLAIALSKVSNVFLPEATEVSPVQVDYAIKGYLGWLGGTISSTSHYAVMPFSKSAYPDANWTETMSMGFIKTLPATQSKYVTAFYENNKDISQAYADMRHFAQLGQADKVQEILEEKGDKIAMAKFYDNASKDMSKMRQAIQAIRNDENMTGAQKKEEIDRMKVLIGDLAQQMEEARLMVKKEYAASR